MSITRRKFLGWLGAAAAGTTLAKTAHATSNKHFTGYPNSMLKQAFYRLSEQYGGVI